MGCAAVGGTQICLRKVEPPMIYPPYRRASGDASVRRSDCAQHAGSRTSRAACWIRPCGDGWDRRRGSAIGRHPDGAIEIKDRSKDIIISGGENISSLEVEEVLTQHPAIMEAAVVARPDPTWGESPGAFLELKPGAAQPDDADVLAFCRARLARFKVPKTLVFGPLPKTSTGKIQKFLLRERASSL